MAPSFNAEAQRLLAGLFNRSSASAKLGAIVLASILSGALLATFGQGLSLVEERAGALGWTLNPDGIVEERVSMVVIDEASLAEVGPWPWARTDIARLVDAIHEAGARLQIFDIVFPESRPGDDVLIRSLQNANGSVLAQLPDLNPAFSESTVGVMTHPIAGISCQNAQASNILGTGSFIAPEAAFSTISKGHIGALIEPDGAVRRSPAIVCVEGEAFPSLAIAALLSYSGSSEWVGEIDSVGSIIGPNSILTLDSFPGLEIPLDEFGGMRVSFDKSPEAFTAVSAADVMAGRIDAALLDGAWVLVGGTAFGLGDIVPTPFSGAVPGVEIQARLLTSILDMSVPYTPAGAGVISVVMCMLFALVLLGLHVIGDRVSAIALPAAAILLPVLALWIHIVVLESTNIWLGWISTAVFGFMASAMLLLLEFARVRLERARVFGNLKSYLPDGMAREIAYAIPSAKVDARRLDVTLLNADLRNFSAFGEARPPEETAAVLHYFFTKATAIIEEHGGRVQEFKGDSFLAMWDGGSLNDEAILALRAAKELQRSLNDKLLPEQALDGLEPLALGIGIEQGPVLVGSIGPAHRRSPTILGDTLSITLRIQEMTVDLAQPILLGECVARQLSSEKLESQGSYLLTGLGIPHTLFSPSIDGAAGAGVARKNQPELIVVGGSKR